MNNFKKAEQEIKNAKSILVATHHEPDGDAIGSILAVAFYLKKIGKKFYIFSFSGLPEIFKFLPGHDLIKKVLPEEKFDLIFGLDYGARDRMGLADYLKKYPTPILAFDHHIVGRQMENYGVINTKYASTAEIVFDYFKKIKFKINRDIAINLMTGILTDTGFFKCTSNADSLKAVMELMKFNLSIIEIDRALYGHQKLESVKLSGRILERTVYNKEGDFNYSYVLAKDLKGLAIEEISGVLDRIKNIGKGQFALFLIQKPGGVWRGRLRSGADKNYDLNRLAKNFGGGGHKKAAGFQTKGKIDGIVKLVAKYARN